MKRHAIIIDLDGTLYDARDRQREFLIRDDGKKDFDDIASHQYKLFMRETGELHAGRRDEKGLVPRTH